MRRDVQPIDPARAGAEIDAAIWVVAMVTFASGLVVAVRMRETLGRTPSDRELLGRGTGDALHRARSVS